MTYIDALWFGLVQGLTEYLPVSSSAHLILLPRFLKISEPGLAFDVFLHIGTLFATLIYFRRDWVRILTQPASGEWKWIIAGTLPALVVGALVHQWAEDALRGNAVLIVTLALGGVALWWVDRYRTRSGVQNVVTLPTAFKIGLFQCLALVPGMSRSGSTLIGGRWLGLSKAEAARFSFLLSLPVTGAAVVFELRKYDEVVASTGGSVGPLLLGCFAAFLSGMIAIHGLLSWVKKAGFGVFAIYRVMLAFVVWAVLA